MRLLLLGLLACGGVEAPPPLQPVSGARDLGPADALLDLAWDGRDGAAVLWRRGDEVLLRVVGPRNRGGSPERALEGASDARVAAIAGGLVVGVRGDAGAWLLRLDGRGAPVQAPVALPLVPAGVVPDVDGEPSGVVRVAWAVPGGAAVTDARSLSAAWSPVTEIPGASATWTRSPEGFPALRDGASARRLDGETSAAEVAVDGCDVRLRGVAAALPDGCLAAAAAVDGARVVVAWRDASGLHLEGEPPVDLRAEAEGAPGPLAAAAWSHRGAPGGLIVWLQGGHLWSVPLGPP